MLVQKGALGARQVRWKSVKPWFMLTMDNCVCALQCGCSTTMLLQWAVLFVFLKHKKNPKPNLVPWLCSGKTKWISTYDVQRSGHSSSGWSAHWCIRRIVFIHDNVHQRENTGNKPANKEQKSKTTVRLCVLLLLRTATTELDSTVRDDQIASVAAVVQRVQSAVSNTELQTNWKRSIVELWIDWLPLLLHRSLNLLCFLFN